MRAGGRDGLQQRRHDYGLNWIVGAGSPEIVWLYPTSPTAFVCREVPVTGSFQTGAGGAVTGLSITFDGQTSQGTKQ